MALHQVKKVLSSPSAFMIWNIIRRAIESMQIFSLLLVPQFTWPSNILDSFDISWIAFDITGTTYNTLLILLCSIITIYVVISISTFVLSFICECFDCLESISDLCDCNCGDDDLSEYMWWFIGDSILFGIFFVPIGSILLEIFHCKNDHVVKNPDITCGESKHIGLCIWASVTFIFFIVSIYIRATSRDTEQHYAGLANKIRHDVHNIDAYYSLLRLLAMIMIIIVAESSPILSSILLFIVFLIPIVFTVRNLPYVDMKYNYICCSMLAFNAWSAFAVFIVAVVNDRDSYAGFIVWCLFPIFIVFCCILCMLRLKKRPLSK
eukprot:312431_1